MAGPPPGRQQPPNSSDTRESIRRGRRPPARPLPPAAAAARRPSPAAPTSAASAGPGGAGWCPAGHAPYRPAGTEAPRDMESAGLGLCSDERASDLHFPGGIAARTAGAAGRDRSGL